MQGRGQGEDRSRERTGGKRAGASAVASCGALVDGRPVGWSKPASIDLIFSVMETSWGESKSALLSLNWVLSPSLV